MIFVKEAITQFIFFLIGGFLYVCIELLVRGHSAFSMFLAGGFCFVLIGLFHQRVASVLSLPIQMFLSALIITFVEFIIGLIVNLWLGKNIWDYSNQPFNYKGQICLLYTIYWFFLSFPIIYLNTWLRKYFFIKFF